MVQFYKEIKPLLWIVIVCFVALLYVGISDAQELAVNSQENKVTPVDNDVQEIAKREVERLPENEQINDQDGTASQEKSGGSKTLPFINAFVASISVIVVSELGDKTFFIAAIMAMRYSRVTVFTGAISALALMTVLSAGLGLATTVVPRWFTYYLSTLLFAIFGLRMLREGIKMRADEGQEELEEVQAELKAKEEELEREAASTVVEDPESGIIRGGKYANKCWGLLSPILFQAFTLTFLAEWGDRSQLTTIILGARENVFGVILGGTIGHALCTGLAVIGGRMIAQKISVRTVTIIGGILFLVFAVSSLFLSPDVPMGWILLQAIEIFVRLFKYFNCASLVGTSA